MCAIVDLRGFVCLCLLGVEDDEKRSVSKFDSFPFSLEGRRRAPRVSWDDEEDEAEHHVVQRGSYFRP